MTPCGTHFATHARKPSLLVVVKADPQERHSHAFWLHRIARSTAVTMSIDLLLACSLANTTCTITINIMTTLIFIIVSLLHAFSLLVVVAVLSFLHLLMVVAINYYFQHLFTYYCVHILCNTNHCYYYPQYGY